LIVTPLRILQRSYCGDMALRVFQDAVAILKMKLRYEKERKESAVRPQSDSRTLPDV
jgi:hypothetical protein